MVDRENLVYRANEFTHHFENFQAISIFGKNISNGKITFKEVDENQSSLLVKSMSFKNKYNNKIHRKNEKKYILKNWYALFDVEERVLDAFGSKAFPTKIEDTGFSDLARVAKISDCTQNKVSYHTNLKI